MWRPVPLASPCAQPSYVGKRFPALSNLFQLTTPLSPIELFRLDESLDARQDEPSEALALLDPPPDFCRARSLDLVRQTPDVNPTLLRIDLDLVAAQKSLLLGRRNVAAPGAGEPAAFVHEEVVEGAEHVLVAGGILGVEAANESVPACAERIEVSV